MRFLRGVTTVEVMVMLLGMTVVILASYGARFASWQSYRELIHRERAQLYAAETMEELEAMRMTRLQQDFVRSWDLFLGQKTPGSYELVSGGLGGDLQLVPVPERQEIPDDNRYSVRYYDEDDADGFYSRLERRIELRSLQDDKRLVTVSIYWGVPGAYDPDSQQQVQVQAVYSDHTLPGFAL